MTGSRKVWEVHKSGESGNTGCGIKKTWWHLPRPCLPLWCISYLCPVTVASPTYPVLYCIEKDFSPHSGTQEIWMFFILILAPTLQKWGNPNLSQYRFSSFPLWLRLTFGEERASDPLVSYAKTHHSGGEKSTFHYCCMVLSPAAFLSPSVMLLVLWNHSIESCPRSPLLRHPVQPLFAGVPLLLLLCLSQEAGIDYLCSQTPQISLDLDASWSLSSTTLFETHSSIYSHCSPPNFLPNGIGNDFPISGRLVIE